MSPTPVVIIGAGLSGLALSWYLKQLGIPSVLLESADRPGGMVRSAPPFELGPNTLLADEIAIKLIHDLGLTDQVLIAKDVSKERYILKDGQLQALPSGPADLLLSPYFSLKTKLTILRSLTFSKKSECFCEEKREETLTEFFKRHFNQEVIDYALAPFLAGIYGAHPDQLLTRLVFPQLQQFEKEHGSVIKGLAKAQKATVRRQTLTLKQGLQGLTDCLAKEAVVRYGCQVEMLALAADGDSYQITVTDINGPLMLEAKQVVVTTGAKAAGQLLQAVAPDLAHQLAQVPHISITGINTLWNRQDSPFTFNGFGALYPKKEGKKTAGTIWRSAIFSGLWPDNQIGLTSFVIAPPKDASGTTETTVRAVMEEIQKDYGFSTAPIAWSATDWEEALPVYGKQLAAVWDAIRARPIDHRLHFSALWYEGIGLNDAVKRGHSLARRIAEIHHNSTAS